MRKPDYDKMKEMLAYYEAETMQTSDLYEVFLHGTVGYSDISDDEAMKLFLEIWQPSKLPKIKVEE